MPLEESESNLKVEKVVISMFLRFVLQTKSIESIYSWSHVGHNDSSALIAFSSALS